MAVKNYGIHDKWTDISKVNDIEIQSVDGVIEDIKVNGEPAGGGGGDSDFSIAVMTVIADNTEIYAPFISKAPFGGHEWLSAEPIYESGTFNVVLYKGKCSAYVRYDGDLPNITATGNAEVDENYIDITGDCTITIS